MCEAPPEFVPAWSGFPECSPRTRVIAVSGVAYMLGRVVDWRREGQLLPALPF